MSGKRPKKNSAHPPEGRKQKKGRTQQERPVPFCSTFAFEKWNILFLVFIGLLGQPSKNPFHFHLKNGTGSFPYSSASPRNVPLVPLFSETLYIDKKEVHRGRGNFLSPILCPIKVEQMEQCFYSPINRGFFTFHFLIQKVEQELHPPLAVPRLKTRTSRPQGGQSQHRARARCAPASRLCFSDALRGVIRRKKPARVTEYPNGLKTS